MSRGLSCVLSQQVDPLSDGGEMNIERAETPVPTSCAEITSPFMATASRDIFVQNSMGLHARPAMQFVDLANTFASNILVRRLTDPAIEADGKSVMQMIILEAGQGTALRIEADGDDATRAVAELAELFETKFGED